MKHIEPAVNVDRTIADGEKVVLVQAVLGRAKERNIPDEFAELKNLAETAGAVVVGTVRQRNLKPKPSTYLRGGKLQEVEELVADTNAEMVIFDNELSPNQVRNLDFKFNVRIIDRVELILQIFAKHAKSAEAQFQVELANLQHLLPRLGVFTKPLSRIRGGIGARGPGEDKTEERRRDINKRIVHLKKELSRIQKSRFVQGKQRRRYKNIALVGYTNAGKSTLMNALTDKNVPVDDRLFTTLSSTACRFQLSEKEVIVNDTVGFIRDLPSELIASFRSTLESINDADAIVHVADGSSPYLYEQIEVVKKTLLEIGANKTPQIFALNKIDKLKKGLAEDLRRCYHNALFISALKNTGLDELLARLSEVLQ